MPGGQREFFLLGPHSPNLTANEIKLVHGLWLQLGEHVAPEELHHHDVVHFALDELVKAMKDGRKDSVLGKLKQYLKENRAHRDSQTRPPN